MDSAEFKTLREAVGLSVSQAAGLFDVQERTVRYWESGRNKVPAGVADQITGIDAHLEFMTDEAVRVYWEQKPDAVELYRYRDEDALLAAYPDFPWPHSVHAAMLYRVMRRLADSGVEVSIRYAKNSA